MNRTEVLMIVVKMLVGLAAGAAVEYGKEAELRQVILAVKELVADLEASLK